MENATAMRWKMVALCAALVLCAVLAWHTRRPSPPPAAGEKILAVYENKVRCTLYYTPREAGFSAARGFNVSPETREGLRGRQFGRDFLLEVEKEGFGRLQTPVEGKFYIRYWRGAWGFADLPVDHAQRPLVARQTCAFSGKLFAAQTKLRIRAKGLAEDFERQRWIVTDTGSGLGENQLDLYWGEDDPLGPGERMSRPRSGPADVAGAIVSVIQ